MGAGGWGGGKLVGRGMKECWELGGGGVAEGGGGVAERERCSAGAVTRKISHIYICINVHSTMKTPKQYHIYIYPFLIHIQMETEYRAR